MELRRLLLALAMITFNVFRVASEDSSEKQETCLVQCTGPDWPKIKDVHFEKNCTQLCLGDGGSGYCKLAKCTSKCQGAVCYSTCVGKSCSSKCNGSNCNSQCVGNSCSSECSNLLCGVQCEGDYCLSKAVSPTSKLALWNPAESTCNGTNCTSMCDGGFCQAECIGEKCNAQCTGLRCESLCSGYKCNATCDGYNCDATCNGKNCTKAGITPSNSTEEDQFMSLDWNVNVLNTTPVLWKRAGMDPPDLTEINNSAVALTALNGNRELRSRTGSSSLKWQKTRSNTPAVVLKETPELRSRAGINPFQWQNTRSITPIVELPIFDAL